jgi:protein SCO1
VIRHAAVAALALVTGGGIQDPAPHDVAHDVTALPIYESADLTPHWRTARELAATDGRFPPVELRDQSGRAFTRADLAGHIVVANFFFTGCSTLCPRLRTQMGRVRDAFPGDARLLLLSHSVTPEADTVPMLAAYARTNGIDGERWRLLTGEPDALSLVARQAYLLPPPEAGARGVLHTELFVLLDERQRVRGVYNGTLPLDINNLIHDIGVLEKG